MKAAVVATRQLGRFELERLLGRGAQATVWLAHDPRLDRSVAVKLLDPSADSAAVHEWLDEARAVSRLTHPNIVPVFEADQAGNQPYLVFEFVDGPTLAESRKGRGPLAAREAVELMLGVLDALAAAHAQGIVHRDLKPSNILLGTDGRPRVMDFGIAARVAGRSDGRIVGTPGYMSPEAARGEAPAPVMDVFAAGVLLGELLAGQPLLDERDPMRAVLRVQREDLMLPAQAEVDDNLRGIVQRALARDPAQRYDGARAMHAALTAWLHPQGTPDAGASGKGTLDFLLRRMRHKTDFPALSESVVRIQKIATSDTESLASLSTEVLKDVALTNKLLRMVNSAQFSQAAGGGVSTISRAVALVGFAGIRNLALSLVLLEHMKDKSQAAHLKEEFLRSLMAGTLAGELTPVAREGEEAFLGSMFQSLGRLLVEYYFPEEAQQIRSQLGSAAETLVARDAAALRVLGISLQDLGIGVARSWGLPDNLQRCMRTPLGDVPGRRLEAGVERQRWLGRAANLLTDLMLDSDAAQLGPRLRSMALQYAPALGMSVAEISAATERARERLTQLALAMGLQLAADAKSRRLMVTLTAGDSASAGAGAGAGAGDQDTVVIGRVDLDSERAPADLLAAGIEDITNSLVGDHMQLNQVLHRVLDTMHRALQFRRVVFCLRDPKTNMMTGRFGLGDAADTVSRAFRVPLKPSGAVDLFAAVCIKGLDTLIADTSAGGLAERLPAWYRQGIGAPAFLLLPITMKGAPFGLIYADKGEPGSLQIDEKELSLLRTLRNQAVMAFKQAERG
ncbi:MAG: HDOD domain-containing protein [Rubrivivax sp.]|nr:HDOD domain-containing protein [Rubrivivax sp.]